VLRAASAGGGARRWRRAPELEGGRLARWGKGREEGRRDSAAAGAMDRRAPAGARRRSRGRGRRARREVEGGRLGEEGTPGAGQHRPAREAGACRTQACPSHAGRCRRRRCACSPSHALLCRRRVGPIHRREARRRGQGPCSRAGGRDRELLGRRGSRAEGTEEGRNATRRPRRARAGRRRHWGRRAAAATPARRARRLRSGNARARPRAPAAEPPPTSSHRTSIDLERPDLHGPSSGRDEGAAVPRP